MAAVFPAQPEPTITTLNMIQNLVSGKTGISNVSRAELPNSVSRTLIHTTARGFRGQHSARRAVAAAITRRNRATVRAGCRVPQKRADAVCDFRAENVLERAGVRFHRGVIADGEHIH